MDIIKEAFEKDETLGFYVACLFKHKVVGFTSEDLLFQVKKFLNIHHIDFDCNKRKLIWLPELEEGLQVLFMKD